jgi:hypothetical protein
VQLCKGITQACPASSSSPGPLQTMNSMLSGSIEIADSPLLHWEKVTIRVELWMHKLSKAHTSKRTTRRHGSHRNIRTSLHIATHHQQFVMCLQRPLQV